MSVALLLASCSSCVLGPPAPHVAAPDVRASVGLLRLGDEGTCSAFEVAPGYVLTAGHCAEGGEVEYSYEGREAHVADVHERSDLALFIVEGLDGQALPIASHDPCVGCRVTATGFPARVHLTSTGTWSGRREHEHARGVTSLTLWYGSSGSPIVDDDGNVTCVVSQKHADFQGVTFCVPQDDIRTFLTKNRVPFRRG